MIHFGFLVVLALLSAVWLVKHPVMLVSLNAMPLAWWYFGTAGLVATLAVTAMVAATHRGEA